MAPAPALGPEDVGDTQAPTKAQIRRWRRHLAEERMEARTYRSLAERRTGWEREVLLQLAEAERRHEEYWLALLGERALPAPKPRLRVRISAWLAQMFGTIFILAMAQRAEQRTTYDIDEDAPAQMAADEHIHGEVIRGLTARSREALAGTFRAAVFGANDGLVSNLALVLGVAATGMAPGLVLATGVAGLLAGALSMAAGEWVSVRSQRELLDASIPDPDAHQAVPALDVNANELALVFRARGESPEDADTHAATIFAQLARPAITESGAIAVRAALGGGDAANGATEQVGTPWRAASSSFCFFAIGAFFPLVPYIFGMSGLGAIALAALIVGLALLGTGGVVGILSGQSPAPRALRQLLIGYGAAGVTYVLGLLFGTTAGA
ncbi:VIT1/CCC1 transporter family protein [Schaalia hyovaginalis]|uniref:VIT1/CCC1 transporter family protein n=1 Tax=Schaalia hyovaginalis TaxID=29316 RepID=UPI0026EB9AA1|nr:VIT1/CCC1 transporter family protein [Schaalia hyovaginalis]MCI6411657.1 VIT1/CCC1 transporter family protein [Schaalia hyovaginalis]